MSDINTHIEALEALRQQAIPQLEATESIKDLEKVRLDYLGKKGRFAAVAQAMRNLSAEDRPKLGQVMNQVKSAFEEMLESRRHKLEEMALEAKLALETVDVTLPGRQLGATAISLPKPWRRLKTSLSAWVIRSWKVRKWSWTTTTSK